MGQIDTIKDLTGTELVYSKSYYSNIFKKTEKIVSAVFFILNRQEIVHDIKDENLLTAEIKKSSLSVLSLMSVTLLDTDTTIRARMLEVTRQLLLLNSYLSVAMASGTVAAGYGSIISAEISSVLASMGEYGEERNTPRARVERRMGEAAEQMDGSITRAPRVPRESSVSGEKADRKERIKEIIKDKGQVSIKDISDIIKDVSEKSIQRDLIGLIEKGQIIRHGERRWSTYTLT